jgi:hypothetical protein
MRLLILRVILPWSAARNHHPTSQDGRLLWIVPKGVRALLDSSYLNRLEKLDLYGIGMTAK